MTGSLKLFNNKLNNKTSLGEKGYDWFDDYKLLRKIYFMLMFTVYTIISLGYINIDLYVSYIVGN